MPGACPCNAHAWQGHATTQTASCHCNLKGRNLAARHSLLRSRNGDTSGEHPHGVTRLDWQTARILRDPTQFSTGPSYRGKGI